MGNLCSKLTSYGLQSQFVNCVAAPLHLGYLSALDKLTDFDVLLDSDVESTV